MGWFAISANQVEFMRKRISVADLRIGMYIEEFCGSWMDHPFWCARFVVDNEVDLRKIQHSTVEEVWIDVNHGVDVESKGSTRSQRIETDARDQEHLQKVVAGALP